MPTSDFLNFCHSSIPTKHYFCFSSRNIECQTQKMIQLGFFFYLETFGKSEMTFCTMAFVSKDFSVKMEIILKTNQNLIDVPAKNFCQAPKWIRNICSKGKTFLRYFSLDIGWNPNDWIFSIFIPSRKQNLAEITNRLHVQSYSLNCQECQHSDPSTYIIICIYAPTSAFLLK